MSNNRVYKNNQVNMGSTFHFTAPMIYQPPVKKLNLEELKEEQEQIDYKAIGEDIVNKAKIEADMIIKEALLEAKDIVTKASIDVEELKEEALGIAREEGYNEGINKAKSEYEQLLLDAQSIKEQAGMEYEQVLASLETDAVNTILEIAKKVISQELKCKENILLLVKEAFDKCAKDRKAVLKLSQQDYDYVNDNKEQLMAMLQRAEDIEIKKDLSLKEGGCIIETPFGSIDASANTKLDKIENDFTTILDEGID